jgi:hypothetical protein
MGLIYAKNMNVQLMLFQTLAKNETYKNTGKEGLSFLFFF